MNIEEMTIKQLVDGYRKIAEAIPDKKELLRLAEGIGQDACVYFGHQRSSCYGCPAFNERECIDTKFIDIERRLRDLAEKL